MRENTFKDKNKQILEPVLCFQNAKSTRQRYEFTV